MPEPTRPEPLFAAIGQNANFLICELGSKMCFDARTDAGLSAMQVVRGTVHVLDECGRYCAAGPGQLVLLPAGIGVRISTCPQRLRQRGCDEGEIRREQDWMIVDAAAGKRGKALVVALGPVDMVGMPLTRSIFHAVIDQPSGRRTFALLRDEVEQREAGAASFAAALMHACVALALRDMNTASTSHAPPIGSTAIARVAEKMRACPAENYDLATLATGAGMSRATFARQFVAAMRETPMQFLLRMRLEAAGTMLRSTALPIKVIAAASGFASRSHFSRAFTAAFDIDPTGYRNRARP